MIPDDSPAGQRARRLATMWWRRGPVVMGIVNCTPDSFSDGGQLADEAAAVALGLRLIGEGATIVDVGGESTRPGAAPVTAAEEHGRVVPVIAGLRRQRPDAVLSVDTSKPDVAAAALAAGADVVNDVTAAADPAMLATVRDHQAALVMMHMRGTPRTMQQDTSYRHVVAEVHGFLAASARRAEAAGVPPDRVWLDPGIGFGKDDAGNLALLAAAPDLAALGHPVVLGPSRKSFLGRLTGAAVNDRLAATLGALLPALGLARAVVRVHDVAAARQFLTVANQLAEARR